MKKISSLTFRFILLLAASLAIPGSARTETFFGSQQFNNQKMQGKVSAYGKIVAEACKFETLDITGDAEFSHSSINALKVNGKIRANSVTTGTIEVQGLLEAIASDLGKVSLTGNRVTLSGSKAHEIVVERTSEKVQTLFLKNDSKVADRIEFKSGIGTIVTDNVALLPRTIVGVSTITKSK